MNPKSCAITSPPGEKCGLEFLARVVIKETRHLIETDRVLFEVPFSADRARSLPDDQVLAERTDAYVARFRRLQDTLGDKLLPRLLSLVGETAAPLIDNLDRAERRTAFGAGCGSHGRGAKEQIGEG